MCTPLLETIKSSKPHEIKPSGKRLDRLKHPKIKPSRGRPSSPNPRHPLQNCVKCPKGCRKK